MKLSNIRSAILNKVWYSPKTRLSTFLKGKCDEMPHRKRLMVVTVLLSAFILIAFFVFGNACYKMGARQARQTFDIEHIEGIDIQQPVNATANEVD